MLKILFSLMGGGLLVCLIVLAVGLIIVIRATIRNARLREKYPPVTGEILTGTIPAAHRSRSIKFEPDGIDIVYYRITECKRIQSPGSRKIYYQYIIEYWKK